MSENGVSDVVFERRVVRHRVWLRERKGGFIKCDMPRENGFAGSKIKTSIPAVVGGIAKKDAKRRSVG